MSKRNRDKRKKAVHSEPSPPPPMPLSRQELALLCTILKSQQDTLQPYGHDQQLRQAYEQVRQLHTRCASLLGQLTSQQGTIPVPLTHEEFQGVHKALQRFSALVTRLTPPSAERREVLHTIHALRQRINEGIVRLQP